MQSILRALFKYFGNHVWGSFLSHIVNISIREQSIKKYTCNAQLRGLKLVNGLGFARLEFKVQDLNTISRILLVSNSNISLANGEQYFHTIDLQIFSSASVLRDALF